MINIEPKQIFKFGSFYGIFALLSYIEMSLGMTEAYYASIYSNTAKSPYYVWELLLCDAICDIGVSFTRICLLIFLRKTKKSTYRQIILVLQFCYNCVMMWNIGAYNSMDNEIIKYWNMMAPQAMYYIHLHTFLLYTYLGFHFLSLFGSIIPSFYWDNRSEQIMHGLIEYFSKFN